MAFSIKVLSKVRMNQLGFYELIDKPTEEELKKYYSEKYYQENKGSYQKIYSEEELQYLNNKSEQKYQIITNIFDSSVTPKLLDIGCGEGFALSYFLDKGWEVTGLDYSKFGCEMHNPDLVKNIIVGDINDSIEKLIQQKQSYDVIWLDNVLEHVIEPVELLLKCKMLGKPGSILVIEVPNDFSIIQEVLISQNKITEPFWVAIPDHLSYFNREGLINICRETGWETHKVIGDFPIDFYLFNEHSNYIKDRSLGKESHKSRVAIENILHKLSVDKTNKLYELMSELGLGRQLIGFFKFTE